MAKQRKKYLYNTYRFVDKDPVIDILRTLVEITAAMRNQKFGAALAQISRESGVSLSCLYNWFGGETRFPRFATVIAVAHACGQDVKIGKEGLPRSGPRFKSIKGGKAA